MIQYCLVLSDSVKCRRGVGEVIIFEQGCYISASEHVRMLILSSYVLRLLGSVRSILSFNFWAQELYNVYLRFEIVNNVTLE